MKNEPILLIDLDSTIANTRMHFLNYVESILGIQLDADPYTEADVSRLLPLCRKQQKWIKNDIFCTEGFWYSIPVINGILPVLEALRGIYTIKIATAPWDSSKTCKKEKLQWVEKYLPYVDEVFFKRDKWELEGDFIIDDNIRIISNCFEKGKYCAIPLYAYNGELEGIENIYYYKNSDELAYILTTEFKNFW